MDLNQLLAQASEAQVRLALSNLMFGLAELGFGTDEPLDGGDAVQEIDELYLDTAERCLVEPAPPTEACASGHGDGASAESRSDRRG